MQIETERGDKVIGTCPYPYNGEFEKPLYEYIEDFNNMSRELQEEYGRKNVWFDRDRENNRIVFLTH